MFINSMKITFIKLNVLMAISLGMLISLDCSRAYGITYTCPSASQILSSAINGDGSTYNLQKASLQWASTDAYTNNINFVGVRCNYTLGNSTVSYVIHNSNLPQPSACLLGGASLPSDNSVVRCTAGQQNCKVDCEAKGGLKIKK